MVRTNDETPLVVEQGYGYWCYTRHKEPEGVPIGKPDEEFPTPETITVDTEDVYRRVVVEVTEDGDPYAWFRDPDEDPSGWEELTRLIERDGKTIERGGKIYVPINQVWASPLPGHEKA